MVDEKPITLDTFQPLAGETLHLQLEDHVWEAELSDLKELPQHRSDAERAPFTFLLTIAQAGLPQSTYQLTHSGGLEITVFLVPVAGDATSTTLQAIFN